MTFILVINRIL